MICIANEVAALVKQGMPKNHLLVLHTHGVEDLIQTFETRLGKGAARDPKNMYPGNYVRVSTMRNTETLQLVCKSTTKSQFIVTFKYPNRQAGK